MKSVVVLFASLASLLVNAQLGPYPYVGLPYANYVSGSYDDASSGYGAAGYEDAVEHASRAQALQNSHHDVVGHGAHGHSEGHYGRAALLHRDRAYGYEKQYGYDRVYSNAHGYGGHDAAYGNHGHHSSAGGYGIQQDEQFGKLANRGYGQQAVYGQQGNAYGNMLLGGYAF